MTQWWNTIKSILCFWFISSKNLVSFSDQDHPEWLHHPWIPGEVDAHHEDHHSGAGCVLRVEFGERRPPGARGLLLRQHPLPPLHQIQKEWGQTARGERNSLVFLCCKDVCEPAVFLHVCFYCLFFEGVVSSSSRRSVCSLRSSHRRSAVQFGGGETTDKMSHFLWLLH